MTTSRVIEVADRNVVLAMWADAIIEMHRFGCDEDRVLARWDEDDVDALMPSADDLEDIGFDIIGLAMALEAGMDAELFGVAYRHLNIDEFNGSLIALAAGLDVGGLNQELEHLADMVEECA